MVRTPKCDLLEESKVECKYKQKKIKLYQIIHYKSLGINLEFCRDFINRTECFPHNLKGKELVSFIKTNFLDSENHKSAMQILSFLEEKFLCLKFWRYLQLKQSQIETKDGNYFNDVAYYFYEDPDFIKKNGDNVETKAPFFPYKRDKYNNKSIKIMK